MTKKTHAADSPTTAVNLLKKIHNNNAASASDERAHMIADIDNLMSICAELLAAVAGGTGSILNAPDFKAALQPADVALLMPLTETLIRDSQAFQAQLDGLRAQADQFRLIEDWPNMLSVGLSLSSQLADWQSSFTTVVMPIKDQIDSTIQTVVDRAMQAKAQ